MHTHPSAPHTPAPMPTCPSHTHLPLTHLFTHLPAPHIPILTPTCSERWYGLFDRLPPHLMNLLSYLLPHPPAPHTPTLLPAPTSTCSSHTYSHTHLLLTHPHSPHYRYRALSIVAHHVCTWSDGTSGHLAVLKTQKGSCV